VTGFCRPVYLQNVLSCTTSGYTLMTHAVQGLPPGGNEKGVHKGLVKRKRKNNESAFGGQTPV